MNGSDSPRLPEPVRVAVEVARSALASLSPEHRRLAFEELTFELANVVAMQATEQNLEIEALEDMVTALEKHNEQRHQEVWTARKLLGARPDETLPMAVRRALDVVLQFRAADGHVLFASRVGRTMGEFKITDDRVASITFGTAEEHRR